MFQKGNVYTYCSARKIYFAKTEAKSMLIEKKDYHTNCGISLVSHNPIIYCKNNGMLIVPKTK